MSTQPQTGFSVVKKMTTCDCYGKVKDFLPGDKVDYQICVTNHGDEDIQVEVKDLFSDVFVDLVGSENLFGSSFSVPGPIGEWVYFSDVPAGQTLVIDLSVTVAEVCLPRSVTNCVTVCLSGSDDPEELRCECVRAEACAIVIGERADLVIDPDCFNPKGLLEGMLSKGSIQKVIDYCNGGGSFEDLIEKACNPPEPPDLPIEEICDIVIQKFGGPELKAAIVACLTGDDSPITKEVLGDIIQGK